MFPPFQKVFRNQDCQKMKQKLTFRFLLQSIATKQMNFQKNVFDKNFTYEYWLQIVLKLLFILTLFESLDHEL